MLTCPRCSHENPDDEVRCAKCRLDLGPLTSAAHAKQEHQVASELSLPSQSIPLSDAGVMLCVFGSLMAILFPPMKVLGTFGGWRFIFGDAGFGMRNISFIDPTTLVLELILINGVGLALYFIGAKQESQ